MTRSITYMSCIAGAIAGLFIPLWYTPFLLAFVCALFIKDKPPFYLFINLLIYGVICFIYCSVVQSLGSRDLVTRIGELFMGISPVVLSLISSLFYGLNALIGAWCGNVLKEMNS